MYNLGWINLVVYEPHIMVVFKTTLMSYVGDQFLIKKKQIEKKYVYFVNYTEYIIIWNLQKCNNPEYIKQLIIMLLWLKVKKILSSNKATFANLRILLFLVMAASLNGVQPKQLHFRIGTT
jgi:hypothetical protein